ncbi:MAG TPA: EamA family transporter [Candidatus Saccharimonadales bacterium]|nr:EamA family transporter [Candidatus Saccharimonadales bacterium]
MTHLPIWYLTLLIYFVGSTTNSLLQRRLAVTSKLPLRLVTALLYLCFISPIGIIIALIKGNIWIHWQPLTFALLFIEALGIAGFFAFAFQLNKRVDATQYVIISNMYTIITVLLGIFIIHEAFSGQQFLGMLLLIAGGILVAVKGLRRKTFQFDQATLLLALTSVGLGIGLAAERGCLNHMSYSAYLIVGWGLQTVFLCLFAYKDWHVLPRISKSQWAGITKVGVARGMQNTGFFLSVALSRNVSLIASVSSFRVPLVFIASFIFLSEREHIVRRFVGVSVATVGLLLL